MSNTGSTNIVVTYPWGLFVRTGSRALCSDGKVRALAYLASTPDTFFSTPAAVRVNGKYVHGYVTHEEQTYWSGKTSEPFLRVVSFRQHDGQDGILPAWPNKLDEPERYNALIASCHTTQTAAQPSTATEGSV